MTIQEGYGICTFPWATGVKDATRPYFDIGNIAQFGLERVYADLSQSNTKPTYCLIDRKEGEPDGITPVAFDPPFHAGGWRLDQRYQDAHDLGVKTILCLQGAFANQNLPSGTSYRKHPPIDADANPNNPYSYWPLAQLFGQFVLRYGPTKNDALANVAQDRGSDYLNTEVKTGLNTVWAFQGGNEDNFPWHNGPHVLTGYQSGVKWAACVFVARQMSPDARLIAPSFLGATAKYLEELISGFNDAIIDLCNDAALVVAPMHWDWHPSFHRYHREGGQGQTQGADKGATPESVRADILFQDLADVAESAGVLPPICTETGYNDDPSEAAVKQRAVQQPGYTLQESAFILNLRNLLIAQACGVEAVTFYTCRDGYEGQPYTFTGHMYDKTHHTDTNVTEWGLKPGVQKIVNWLNEWGDATVEVGSLEVKSGVWSVLTDKGTIYWTDGQQVEGTPIGPMPYFDEDVIEPPVEPPVEPPTEPETPEPMPPTAFKIAENEFGTFWFEPK